VGRSNSLRVFTPALVFLCLALQARAIETLTDNNSVAQIDPNSQAGMFSWTVDGVQNLFQQWFWYGVGTKGPRKSIDTLSAPAITAVNAATRYITYTSGAYSVEVDYVLSGQSPGSGTANIRESIRIHNFTASPLNFHFFQYSDFDLNGSIGGDTVQLG